MHVQYDIQYQNQLILSYMAIYLRMHYIFYNCYVVYLHHAMYRLHHDIIELSYLELELLALMVVHFWV